MHKNTLGSALYVPITFLANWLAQYFSAASNQHSISSI